MIQPRRAVHAASLAISAIAGGLLASVLTWRLGGGAATIGSVWLVTVVATLLGAWAVFLGGRMPASRYGAIFMAGSAVRLLATLAIGLALDLGGGELERTAFWLGVVVAALVVIIGDSMVGVRTLAAEAGDGTDLPMERA